MRKYTHPHKQHKDHYVETDIDESCPPNALSSFRPKGNKKIHKFGRELKNPQATQIKLFRFSLKHSRKTLRVPCYQEAHLNFPHRFTRRLNAMQADNDVETDEQVAENETKRCQNWLREAVLANLKQEQ